MNKRKVIGTFTALGERVTAVRASYVNNGRLGVELIADDGEHWAMLSVNLVDAPELKRNYFYAKTWSENESIRGPALASGLFEDTGERVPTEFVVAEIWKIKTKGETK